MHFNDYYELYDAIEQSRIKFLGEMSKKRFEEQQKREKLLALLSDFEDVPIESDVERDLKAYQVSIPPVASSEADANEIHKKEVINETSRDPKPHLPGNVKENVDSPPAAENDDFDESTFYVLPSSASESVRNLYRGIVKEYHANMKSVNAFKNQKSAIIKEQESKIRKLYSQISNDTHVLNIKIKAFREIFKSAQSKDHLYLLYDFMGVYLFRQINSLGPISPEIRHQEGFAKLLAALMQSEVKLIDFLLYHFYVNCPYTIPILPLKRDEQNDAEYRVKELKFKKANETEDKYRDRMEAIMYFFGAISVQKFLTMRNEGDLNYCWAWFARIINQWQVVQNYPLFKKIVPVFIKAMLKECGPSLMKLKPGAANSLFNFLVDKYIKIFDQDAQQRTLFTLDELHELFKS